MFRKFARASAVVLVAASAAALLAGSAAAVVPGGSPSMRASGLAFASVAGYNKMMAARTQSPTARTQSPTARTQSPTGDAFTPSSARPSSVTPNSQDPGAPTDPWVVLPGNWTAVNDKDVPYRTGTKSFGYVKASYKHNLKNYDVVNSTVMKGEVGPDEGYPGDTYTGVIFFRQDPNVATEIIVGTTPNTYSYALGSYSPDGRPVGVLTAYCTEVNTFSGESTQQCPDWVNSY